MDYYFKSLRACNKSLVWGGYLIVLARKTAPTTLTPNVWSSSANSFRLLPVVMTSSIMMTHLPTMLALMEILELETMVLLSCERCLLSLSLIYLIA